MMRASTLIILYPDHSSAARNTFQCLWKDKNVWMGDRTKKAIKNIEIGNSVLTFHPETLKVSSTLVVAKLHRETVNI
jgi:hypothetical protein